MGAFHTLLVKLFKALESLDGPELKGETLDPPAVGYNSVFEI